MMTVDFNSWRESVQTKTSDVFNRVKDTFASEMEGTDGKPYLSPAMGAALFGGIGMIGMGIGASLGTYVFFGTVTLAGLVALIESNPKLKYIAKRTSRGIDIFIFAATIYAAAKLGITAAAALTFAGLGYTLIYSPYLRRQRAADKAKDK